MRRSQTAVKMVKGNDAIPKLHQRKHFQPGSAQKGNFIVRLDQPKRKEHRRRQRLIKAKKVFPRPLRNLRPSVNCPTVRYNFKKRLGRGFSAEELAAAGVNPNYARTVGIRVDLRRKNLSEEGLKLNTQRLKTYLSKLVLFPINHNKIRAGEADAAAQKTAVQDRTRRSQTVQDPAKIRAAAEAPRKLSADEKKKKAYRFLKKNISAVRFMGARISRALKAEARKKKEDK
jgi:large subunit ribosomal protein L13e